MKLNLDANRDLSHLYEINPQLLILIFLSEINPVGRDLSY
jgi:hypothetical protein